MTKKEIHIINQEDLIDERIGCLYSFHSDLEGIIYPQVHDFYEIVLVTEGTLRMNVSGEDLTLRTGNLMLIRPGDVHSKSACEGNHISLAFSNQIFEQLMEYLCCYEFYKDFKQRKYIKPLLLKNRDFFGFRNTVQEFSKIPGHMFPEIRTTIRRIVFFIWDTYLRPEYHRDNIEYEGVPDWFAKTLNLWQNGDNRQKGLDFFVEKTGFSKEHICRAFKRYLGMSSSAYMNRKRLKYAIELMGTPGYSMIEIAYEAGFKSASRFYHVFRAEYGISPKQFMIEHTNQE